MKPFYGLYLLALSHCNQNKTFKMSSSCALAWCRSQTDGDKKSGGFFRLPSLAKQREYRRLVVEGAGLPEIYKEKEGDFRLCFRHYKETDFDTKGQRLKLKKGIIEPIYVNSVSPVPKAGK